jgi:matrix metalloproteinase-14 (membrane-inserted)
VNWGNGKAYFFKGSEYLRWDITTDKADPGYPKPIDSKSWNGLPGLTVLMLSLIG